MRRHSNAAKNGAILVWVALNIALGGAGVADSAEGADPAKDRVTAALRQRIQRLVDELGANRFFNREQASRELRKIGEPALPALRAAIREKGDPERVSRARRIYGQTLLAAGIGKESGVQFGLIPAGEFQMGSPVLEKARKSDEPQHVVKINQPFFIGRYEMTQAVFQRVMQHQPSWFSPTGDGKLKVLGKPTDQFPVEQVSWFDALELCNRLSALDGLSPYYRLEEVRWNEKSIQQAKVSVVGGGGYRLPTEAEWEYACRAGTTTAYHFGKTNNGSAANVKNRISTGYGGYSTRPGWKRTTKVGSYKPNGWGLFDMHGNVAEWCGDWYGKEYYAASVMTNPPGPGKGIHRVVRGGAWLISNDNCRSASRFWNAPAERKYYLGFRIAKTPSRYVLDAIR